LETVPSLNYQTMNKLLIAILYFGVASCGNPQADPSKIVRTTLPTDSVTTQSTVLTKADFSTSFGANTVTQMGRAINGIFQDVDDNYWFAPNERALQNGFFEMVTEEVQGITFTFSALEIGKSIKCLHFCD